MLDEMLQLFRDGFKFALIIGFVSYISGYGLSFVPKLLKSLI